MKSFTLLQRKKALILFFACFLFAHTASHAQMIVETFEEAAWTSSYRTVPNGSQSITFTNGTGGTSSATFGSFNKIIVPVTATSTSTNQTISTYSANNITATVSMTTAVGTSTGNWEWGVWGTASITSSANFNAGGGAPVPHSGKSCIVLGSQSGYLVTPIISDGIASITFWQAQGNITVGLKTVFTGNATGGTSSFPNSAYPTTQNNAIGNPGNVTMQYSLNASTYPSANAPAVQRTYTIPSSLATVPGAVAFYYNNSNVSLDDIAITSSLVVTPNIALSDNATQVAAANIAEGSTNNILHKFKLAVTSSNATLTGLTCTTAGTYESADIANMKVRYSTDGTLDAGDATLSTITSIGAAGSKIFTSFSNQTIINGSTGYIFITTDIAAGAAAGGNTISVNAISTADVTFTLGNKTGSTTAGGTQTIIAPAVSLADNGIQITAGNINDNSTNNILHKFQLSVTTANATLTGLSCTTTGSYDAADITNLKVRYSTDAVLDAGDATLSIFSAPGSAGNKTFPSFISQVINSSSTGYIFITVDIAAGAYSSGNTININAITTSNLTFGGGSKSGSTTAGGTQTIIGVPVISGLSVAALTTTTATLSAAVNPNGGAATTNTFDWGNNTLAPPSYVNTNATPTTNPTASGNSNVTSTLSLTGLTANTLYNYRFKANNGSLFASSNATFTTLPNAPVVGTAITVTSSGFTANWSAPTGMGTATYTYTVEASTSNTFGSIAATGTALSSGATSYVFSGLASGTLYYFRVKAVNVTGSSAWSSTSAGVSTLELNTPTWYSANFVAGPFYIKNDYMGFGSPYTYSYLYDDGTNTTINEDAGNGADATPYTNYADAGRSTNGTEASIPYTGNQAYMWVIENTPSATGGKLSIKNVKTGRYFHTGAYGDYYSADGDNNSLNLYRWDSTLTSGATAINNVSQQNRELSYYCFSFPTDVAGGNNTNAQTTSSFTSNILDWRFVWGQRTLHGELAGAHTTSPRPTQVFFTSNTTAWGTKKWDFNIPSGLLATVSGTAATGVASNGATLNGNIGFAGTSNATITARGFKYSTDPNFDPVTQGTSITAGTGTGAFNGNVSGLNPCTVYYYYAYANNSYTARTSSGNPATYTNSTSGGTKYSARYSFTTTAAYNWTGVNGSAWSNTLNWGCAAIPSSGDDVTIPSSAVNFPDIANGTVSIRNLAIASGASLNISGTGVLQIAGTITNNGTLDATAGTIELNGTSAQTLAGSAFVNNSIEDLKISNNVTLSDSLNITDSLYFGSTGKTFNTGNNLVLISDASGTATVGNVNGNMITGQAIVQRYIPESRTWRMLTAPVSGIQTVFDSWQISADNTPGKGMFVSGPSANIAVNGLDPTPRNNPSMYIYNGATQSLSPVLNTKTNAISTNAASAANIGYFTFVRGDRNPANISDPTYGGVSSPTTLAAKGNLQTGDQVFSVTSGTNKLTIVPNPYAADIDFTNVTRTNVTNKFWTWSTKIGDVGGYVNGVWNAGLNHYDLTPDSTLFGNEAIAGTSEIMQSGQAFFVESAGAGAAVTIKESDKVKSHNPYTMFRPQAGPAAPSIRASLLRIEANNTTKLMDGVLAQFDNAFSNLVDTDDAIKFTNQSESMSFVRDAVNLTVEKRSVVTGSDTLFLDIIKTTVRKYRLAFSIKDWEATGMLALLEDTRTGQTTPLNMNGQTLFDFSIVNAMEDQDRFRIVFAPSTPLPVQYSSIKASKIAANEIIVEWKVENEVNIKQYEVERSNDGINFITIGHLKASSVANYAYIDQNASGTNNYYRIKSISNDGKVGYSSVVRIIIGDLATGVSVYPNPVMNNTFSLQFNNVQKGKYDIRLLNTLGQSLMTKEIIHNAQNTTETIILPATMIKGIYNLEVIDPARSKKLIKLIKE